MDRGAPCPICSSETHSAMDCSTLTDALKEGFYKPPSGYRDENDGEDDSLSTCVIDILQAIFANTFLEENSARGAGDRADEI